MHSEVKTKSEWKSLSLFCISICDLFNNNVSQTVLCKMVMWLTFRIPSFKSQISAVAGVMFNLNAGFGQCFFFSDGIDGH